MTQSRRITFKVSFILPGDATIAEARNYIEDAVSTLKGSLMPYGIDPERPYEGDPMSELDGDTVRVTQHKRPSILTALKEHGVEEGLRETIIDMLERSK